MNDLAAVGLPLRRCIVSGAIRPKSDMIRFIHHHGRVVPDYAGTGPGRGAWVTPQKMTLALKKSLFAKAFRTSVSVEPGWVETVRVGLETYCLHLLVKAFQAGYVRLSPGPLDIGWIEPPETTPVHTDPIPRFRLFSQAQLETALRTMVTLAAISPSKLGRTLCAKLSILTNFS